MCVWWCIYVQVFTNEISILFCSVSYVYLLICSYLANWPFYLSEFGRWAMRANPWTFNLITILTFICYVFVALHLRCLRFWYGCLILLGDIDVCLYLCCLRFWFGYLIILGDIDVCLYLRCVRFWYGCLILLGDINVCLYLRCLRFWYGCLILLGDIDVCLY
mgnify:CR=1 FL=1